MELILLAAVLAAVFVLIYTNRDKTVLSEGPAGGAGSPGAGSPTDQHEN
jgi:hypothetical protein